MNEVSISNFKKLTMPEIQKLMPFAVTADGVTVGIFQAKNAPITGKTKCPNCKLVYDFTPDDGKPFFFSMKRPNH